MGSVPVPVKRLVVAALSAMGCTTVNSDGLYEPASSHSDTPIAGASPGKPAGGVGGSSATAGSAGTSNEGPPPISNPPPPADTDLAGAERDAGALPTPSTPSDAAAPLEPFPADAASAPPPTGRACA